MERGGSIVRVSIVGVAVNLVLVAFKAAVGFVTGSIAIIMDAVNNLSDALSSIITIVGTKLACKEPDKKHPYGHGQIEYVTSITVAVIVLAAGVAALKESVGKIISPIEAHYTAVPLLIIAVAVVVKLLLGRYVKGQGRKLNSEALVASGTDAMFDSLISLATLIGAVVAMVWHVSVEGWLGAGISIIMLKSGVELLLESLGEIIGVRVDSELSTKLKAYICQNPQVLGAYDLTLHRYGPEKIIGSVHIEVPDDMTAREIHALTRKLMERVFTDFGIVLTVGIYASNTVDGKFLEMKEELRSIVAKYPEVLQMHGFYVDTENGSVWFDLIIDFGSKRKDEIRDEIVAEMESRYPEYRFGVVLDSDISD